MMDPDPDDGDERTHDAPRRAGWLWKRSDHLHRFNGRWVETKGGVLRYWASRSAAARARRPRRSVSLAGAYVAPASRVGSHPYCLHVVPAGAKVPLILACATDAERGEWLEVLLVGAMIAASALSGSAPKLPSPGAREAAAPAAEDPAGPRAPRALFLYGRGGGGHLASAVAVRDCLESHTPPRPAGDGPSASGDASLDARLAVDMVDVGKLVEAGILGPVLSSIAPFSGDDVYNFFMKQGQYGLAAAATDVGMSSIDRNAEALVKFFSAYLEKERPDVVVSYVPSLNVLLRRSLALTLPRVELLTVITDMESSPAHRWIDPYDPTPTQGGRQHTIVAGGARLHAQAWEAGYPPDKVLATEGMVVHPKFYAVRNCQHSSGAGGGGAGAAAEGSGADDGRESGSQGSTTPSVNGGLVNGLRKVVIFFGGFAPPRTSAIADALLHVHGARVQLIVLCGRNEELRKKLQDKVDKARSAPGAHQAWRERKWSHAVIEGFVPAARVVEHLAGAACVVGKPGPGAASEAAVLRVPFVTEVGRDTMPQERCVVDWLVQGGYGIVAPSLERCPADLLEQADECRQALRGYSNHAVFQVAARVRACVLAARGAEAPAAAATPGAGSGNGKAPRAGARANFSGGQPLRVRRSSTT
eukprot:CAMPEP_0185164730 /NCGR_PEP_ID=MMETSP1139-20130426/9823_1 /TAXON_ID=298111 /ORGANISM="Pavlova sp., Strain CCMP459" /LENGTH=644 /DNA_ID=CAMNT_0027730113 /DNA_START=24 /DNA_END=1958 /DNA_ORIENTATION=-